MVPVVQEMGLPCNDDFRWHDVGVSRVNDLKFP